MLTRRRAAAAVILPAIWCLAGTLVAPKALAASGAAVARTRDVTVTAPGLGRSATTQLIKDLRAAWQITRGHGVTVAVVSEGIDASAPGLTGKVTVGPTFGKPNGNKSDGTVFASAVAGSGPSSSNPYGTLGLAPEARILSLRVQWNAPAHDFQVYLGDAIRYAASHGAQVVYVASDSTDVTAIDTAVAYAEARNVVVIGAEDITGKQYQGQPAYPSSLPGVLGAGQVLLPGAAPPYRKVPGVNNYSVLVAAPGNSLYVTGPAGQGYTIYNWLATAAWLTATVVLVKSVYPGLSPALVARALALSARDRPAGGYSTSMGFGLINPAGALHDAATLSKLPVNPAPGRTSVRPSARLAAGPAPGVISAVHHAAWKLAVSGAAAAIGISLLAVAAILPWRWRRKRVRDPVGQAGGGGAS